ncbi:MAG TPA: efflux RND transporter periplasmic adaptor subunit, partial [Thermoanaerobaculia bacterium]|nr:efflux RND transporter periplasmic adaptor subunit [Thermoanaerobaculia bacterium]
MDPVNKTVDLSGLRIDRDAEPQRGRYVFPAIATVVVLAIGAVLLLARKSGTISLTSPEVATTRVALVTPTQASTVLTASGYIVARAKAEISPKSVGRIAWLHLEEGQKVKKGELVARLESQELEAQKKQYTAQKEQLKAQLDNARVEKQRAATMWNEKVGSKQAFDAADTQVKAFEAQVASADSQIRYVEELIKNAEIYAPIDGVVTVKKAFVGETVAPQGFGGAGSAGATFAVIVDLSSLEMEADINEQNLAKLASSQPAEVTLDAYPEHPYEARLRQIVPTADRQKGSVKVKIELLHKDDKVLPEMSCRVVFINPQAKVDAKAESKVMVPTSSVVEVGGDKGVLLVTNDRAAFKRVELGAVTGTQRQVLSGL